jgi:hypothetical protein
LAKSPKIHDDHLPVPAALAGLGQHLAHARVVGHAGQRARDAEQQARQVRFVEGGGVVDQLAQVARHLVAVARIQLRRAFGFPAAARGEPGRRDEVVEADHGLDAALAAGQQHVAVVFQRGHREHALDRLDARPFDREAEGVQAERGQHVAMSWSYRR